MRTVILCKKFEKYLRDVADKLDTTFGIVIGQRTSEDNFYIVHLARLSEDEEIIVDKTKNSNDYFENVDVQSLADQWISASKMTPGSFSVVGIFIASKENAFNIDQHSKNIKKFLLQLNNLISHNSTSFGYVEHDQNTEILLLSYSTLPLTMNCKIFSNSLSGGNLMPLECKIVDKLPQWFGFESNYELDDVFPIKESKEQVNIENQFKAALEAVKLNINNSEIFIEHQNIDDKITLENYLKDNSKKKDINVFKASVFLNANLANESVIKIKTFNGTIRFFGIVSSRVWCHAKNTIDEIKESIKRDILRSLASRIQIYCDGLTDIHSNNIDFVVSEPPRRIYFCGSKSQAIQFSEYIFRGETPSVAVAQAKQILDMDINSDCIFDDLEGLPDDQTTILTKDTVSSQKSKLGPEISRAMYMLGIALAFLVLLSAIVLHYLLL